MNTYTNEMIDNQRWEIKYCENLVGQDFLKEESVESSVIVETDDINFTLEQYARNRSISYISVTRV